MIVLTIMVAIGAVAWPSLRRPMADSAVQQAANLLRDEIANCRQLAQLSGQPRLMRFDAGRSVVKWGSWTELIAEQLCEEGMERLAAEDSVSENDANEDYSNDEFANGGLTTENGSTATSTIWSLPLDIVVDEVQLDRTRYVDSDDPLLTDALDASIPESSEAMDDESTSRWYLPFLSNGQTRDAVVVLRDSVSGSRVALELDAITGMMRVSRLTALEPEQAAEMTNDPPGDFSEDAVTTQFDLEPIP
ncbi:hypothetical protein CA13_22800 [Planctomycetes bacterium CA13]|uniref:General secretion pathway GspH domain-containing protein n=2 Tax=Novipirellula herctigrandis TaxID=2527986 RepID=A0A5C5Z0K1_9BACT|nr:hypothetical protein CA13_22800 [Planctomycetes bacterium CA13]